MNKMLSGKPLLPFSIAAVAIAVMIGGIFLFRQTPEPQPIPNPSSSPTPAPTPQPTLEEDSKYIGTYSFGMLEKRSGLLMIKNLRPGVLTFYLDVNRGAPSYNMGSIGGELTFENDIATYTKIREYGGICQLNFEFKNEKIIVEQTEEDFGCGFGHGVHANGEYVKTSTEAPVFYNTIF